MKKIIPLVVLIIVIFFGYSYFYENFADKPADYTDSSKMLFEVKKGTVAKNIAKSLKNQGLIRNEYIFNKIAKENGFDSKFQAGKYELNKTMTSYEIAKKIAKGDVYRDIIKITIPEGYDYNMVVDTLYKNNIIDDKKEFDDICENYDFNYKFLKTVNKNAKHRLEGFLFPATYEFDKDLKYEEIVKIMLNKFNEIFKDEYYKRADDLNMSVNDIITLASIIEREGAFDDEFKIISGVFYNRMKNHMKLESCATVQYILNERKPVLSYDDVNIKSDYNTYLNYGLPPSPIAMPGEKAIIAALYPEKTDYYFFVVSGKNDKKHTFSKTYAEHLKNANKNLHRN